MLTLNQYRKAIHLDDPWEYKVPGSLESRESLVDFLLTETGKDQRLSSLYSDRRKVLLSHLTTWNPSEQKWTETFKAKQNDLLQLELREREITEVKSLPTIKDLFPESTYPFASEVLIWRGDITDLKVDAIVNAANAPMLGCFTPFHRCIDNAIHSAAGVQLREDCYEIMKLRGVPEETGQAKITRAYNLPSSYVIHTVGPIVRDDKPTPDQKEQLASCYRSCLDMALELEIKSIALCGISTGVFGYPPIEAAFVAIATVTEWLKQHAGVLDRVVLNVFSERDEEIYKAVIGQWK
jgi:O-acetyl-ADP-ribose deacetylase (regulator of RNase III)